MRTGILTILAYFVMCSVSYASDVYITQSGASLTANIKLRKVSYLQLLMGGLRDRTESLREF